MPGKIFIEKGTEICKNGLGLCFNNVIVELDKDPRTRITENEQTQQVQLPSSRLQISYISGFEQAIKEQRIKNSKSTSKNVVGGPSWGSAYQSSSSSNKFLCMKDVFLNCCLFGYKIKKLQPSKSNKIKPVVF